MTTSAPSVQIHETGLVAMQARLRAAGKELPKELRLALNEITNVILLPKIREKQDAAMVLPIGSKNPTHKFRGGKLQKKTRATSQQRAGIVTEGGATTPYAGWWEFGGSTHSSQGDTSREFLHEGRSMYPALAESTHEIQFAVVAMMDRLAMIAS